MKTILLLPLLLASTVAHAQAVLRVSNNFGTNAPYSTIQAAVAAANTGDIIMVDGSPSAYNVGTFNLTKQVTIQGPGYFLNENTGLQASQNSATISGDNFLFQPGSNGSKVIGLNLNISLEVKTSNITISNNRFIGGTGIALWATTPASNLLITGNYMVCFNYSIQHNAPQGAAVHTNVVVSFNFFLERITFTYGGVFGIVFNNVFATSNTDMPNFGVTNNIFLGNANWATQFQTTDYPSIRKNVFVVGPQAGADPSNVFSASLASLFVGLPGNTTDTQWRLKPGSPAIGAGEGGVDCGMYGSSSSYWPSGIKVGQPTVTNFTVPAIVNQNGVLNVKVSGKVN